MIKDGLSSCQAEKELEYLRVENVALRAQLDAEKRRADAAVEDIYRIASCDACKHYDADKSACAKPSAEIRECFDWRGPQEAWKGE
jgi:hypothetical protein